MGRASFFWPFPGSHRQILEVDLSAGWTISDDPWRSMGSVGEVALIRKDPAPLATGDLAHDVELLEQTERGGHGRSGQSGAPREVADATDWMFDERLVHS